MSSFHKMHGLGNDFVIIDARVASNAIEITQARAAAIADRHHGIGCDQLIILRQSSKADVRMDIYNNDGSPSEACGNATRCVVSLLGKDVSIETDGGLLAGTLSDTDSAVTINMGEPAFDWEMIPLAYAMDSANIPVGWEELNNPIAVNVGNPHIIFFVDDIQTVDIERLGPQIETDPLFPERINVNIAEIRDGAINLRVWERGAGLTQACGTGACATAVAAIKRNLVSGSVKVNLPGGTLLINWALGQSISMNGPATHVFTGQADWASFG